MFVCANSLLATLRLIDIVSRIIIILSMTANAKRSEPKPTRPHGERHATPRKTICSEALLGAARELLIEHNGREYRLRVTSQGNLILTA
jgi:hemin uptake protein HemP